MKARNVLILFALAALSAQISAQALPAGQTPPRPQAPAAQLQAPEIFLVPFIEEAPKNFRVAFLTVQRSGIRAGKPVVNITNNPGYDNQPHFLPDSSGVMFSSNRDGAQNDIYRYDMASKTVVQVTNTPENEYSPTMTPDGRTFTTVRGAEQRLWRFNMDGSDAGLAWAHQGLIGYHAWVSHSKIAAFILGAQRAPNTLQLMDLRTGASDVIESSIGRSLLIRPGHGTVSFVHKPQGTSWMVKELNTATRVARAITPTVEGSEDLAWTPGGVIVMGLKSKLFHWEESTDRWIELADLAKAGVENITRLTVSPDGRWIAIVSQAAVAAPAK